jgi:hypothetical protein
MKKGRKCLPTLPSFSLSHKFGVEKLQETKRRTGQKVKVTRKQCSSASALPPVDFLARMTVPVAPMTKKLEKTFVRSAYTGRPPLEYGLTRIHVPHLDPGGPHHTPAKQVDMSHQTKPMKPTHKMSGIAIIRPIRPSAANRARW